MKNKLVYIILLLLISVFTMRNVAEIQTLTVQNVDLTAQNEALQQDIATLETVVSEYRQTIAEFAKENEQVEAQKTNRGGERIRYPLTEAERDLVERVVMAEAQGEPYEGQMLVCQCILNACEIDKIRPAETVQKYVYAKSRPEPSDSVKSAVSAVFDRGETVTDEPIVYFYAPGIVQSKFHEAQIYTLTVGGHKFFCERK